MKIWTREEEAENLTKLMTGINRSALAREFGINHNIIYQHMTGRKPISMHVAVMYAKAFKLPMEKISPRLALEAEQVRQVQEMATPAPTRTLSHDAEEFLTLFEKLDQRGKKKALLALYDVIDAQAELAHSQAGLDKSTPVNYGRTLPQADLVAVVQKHYSLSVDDINEKHQAATGESLPHRSGSPGAAVKHRKLKAQ